MALNEYQNKALKLLEKLTPMAVEKRALRDFNFLSTSDTGIDYKLFPSQWREWCVGWTFHVIPAFAIALDIQLTEKIEKCFEKDGKTPIFDEEGKQRKKTILIWTQGSVFDFRAGYTLYDTVQYPQETWQDFLQRVACALTVVDARPAEPARGATKLAPGVSRDSGSVTFDVFVPNGERTKVVKKSTHIVTQDDFVKILIASNDAVRP